MLAQCQQDMQLQLDEKDAQLTQQADSHQKELATLQQQNTELKQILDSSMHSKRSVTLKLETAMHALNLSKEDAGRFLQVCTEHCESQVAGSCLCKQG